MRKEAPLDGGTGERDPARMSESYKLLLLREESVGIVGGIFFLVHFRLGRFDGGASERIGVNGRSGTKKAVGYPRESLKPTGDRN